MLFVSLFASCPHLLLMEENVWAYVSHSKHFCVCATVGKWNLISIGTCCTKHKNKTLTALVSFLPSSSSFPTSSLCSLASPVCLLNLLHLWAGASQTPLACVCLSNIHTYAHTNTHHTHTHTAMSAYSVFCFLFWQAFKASMWRQMHDDLSAQTHQHKQMPLYMECK